MQARLLSLMSGLIAVAIAAQMAMAQDKPCASDAPLSEDQLASCSAAIERNAAIRAELLIARATLYTRTDRRDMALSDYTEAIRLVPSANAFFARGEIHRAAGDKRRALADYDAAFRLDPSSEPIRVARKSLATEIERAGAMMPVQSGK